MPETTLPWILFVVYAIAIVGLAVWNRRKASSMEGFAVGSRRVPPFFVGLSLAANMTSVATFVINPGLIHAYGWSGIVGYGFAAPTGIFLALIVTTKKFRQIGDKFTVLTVPQWLGDRYGDRRLTVLFAVASLLQITFLVLIVTALVLVLMSVLHISMWVGILIVVALAFTSILLGGASLHVVSNSVQAMTMLAVAVLLVASGLEIFSGGLGAFFGRLDAVAPFYGSVTNPTSLLFRDLFEVVVANFVIGVAIIMQPHIISKSLYLRTERDVNVYLVTAMVAGTVFTTVLLVGLYARVDLGAGFAPDQVVASYISTSFTPGLTALIMLGLLAAGFSTLEGIILALSTIFANDFWANVARAMGMDDDAIRGASARRRADLPGRAGARHRLFGVATDRRAVALGGDLRPERRLRALRRDLRAGGLRALQRTGDGEARGHRRHHGARRPLRDVLRRHHPLSQQPRRTRHLRPDRQHPRHGRGRR